MVVAVGARNSGLAKGIDLNLHLAQAVLGISNLYWLSISTLTLPHWICLNFLS